MRQLAVGIAAIVALCGASLDRPPWPECAVRPDGEGGPAIVIDGAPLAPVFFAGNNQFARDEVLVEELRKAAQAGIRLFTFNVSLDWYASDAETARVVERFCAAHPTGYFLVRIWLGANADWLEAHPDDRITTADGSPLAFASPSSRTWRDAAARQLAHRIRTIIDGPYGHQFIGVIPTYLQTGEWFYPNTNAFMDYSPANLAAFRGWLRQEYGRNKALRKAWNDPEVTFRTAAFPTAQARDQAAIGPFRDPATHRPAMDLQRFQSDMIVDTIAHFAGVAKEATRGRSLVGAFYGYTMELNNNGRRALAHSGHLAFAKLLECDAVDMIHAPYSYFERRLGQPGHLHLPVDSVALHGKLAVLEEDTFTHLAREPSPDLAVPGWRDRPDSLEGSLALLGRNAGTFLTHRCGFWLFDLLADGRWNDPAFWDAAAQYRRIAAELRTAPPFAPEVAFIVDEDSVHFLRATTHPLLLESLARWRAELARTGAPIGYYLQRDLPRLPDSVKVLILANAYQIDKPERRAIKDRLARGATVIWTYAPDVAGPAGIDFARIGAVTGIPVEARDDAVPVGIVSELTGETHAVGHCRWRPRFVVADEAGIDVVARYAATGEVSAAARPMGKGVSLYTATPRLPRGLLREVFRRAGVHLYHDRPDMTGVAGPYLIVHTDGGLPDETIDEIVADMRGERVRTFSWPKPCRRVTRLAPFRQWPLRPDGDTTWRDALPGGATALYRCD